MIRWILRTTAFYSDGVCYKNKDIIIENGRISDIRDNAKDEEAGDLSGFIVLPGFIDIHVHGGNGFDTMDGTYNAINTISVHKLKEGVTAFCPTTLTARRERMIKAIDAIRVSMKRGVAGAKVLGGFLEGPYISTKYAGAHPTEHIKKLSISEASQLLELGQGCIKSIAVAPELLHAIDFIGHMKQLNVNVRIGHSNASYEEATAAIECGANTIIHTFNAMSPFTHRNPGMVGAALENDKVYAELICDFVHTHRAAAKILFLAKGPEKIILVSDAMRATGMPDGKYMLGELSTTVIDGTARTESGSIAGSTLTILQAVKNMVSLGASFEDISLMACSNPAKAIGEFKNIGSIEIGKSADIIALDRDLNLQFCLVGE
ncbi:MAG: N-acetylglucosamine-6-phosphate deacetylase [Clostridiales bacterium]|jgi:N-acetylglucosamine-6-phosphate deacetylase|nr:N-acetylglucosamine-6-phosphate deacetylase [Clostridiales bacterium]